VKNKMTRRQFVGGALAAVAGAPALLRGQNLNNKLNIAVIGVGGRGGASVSGVRSENIVALCDVNAVTLDTVGPRFPQAKRFTDLRRCSTGRATSTPSR
jgi:cell division GTPase FtsZ